MIETKKWTSAILIILFVLGILFLTSDYFDKFKSKIFVKANANFEIKSVEVSHKNSLYRDIAKAKEGKPTVFKEKNNVFEITLFNKDFKNILIDSVGVEVLDISEFPGDAEHIPNNKVISIPIEHKKGDNWKTLTDPIIFKSGDILILLIRLEPKGKESDYRIRFKVKGDGIIKESEILAIRM